MAGGDDFEDAREDFLALRMGDAVVDVGDSWKRNDASKLCEPLPLLSQCALKEEEEEGGV